MGWTPDQEKAIYAPSGDGNILVSAAAGSGKTAVLVERIIQKILGGGSIDRLLVVTFTNAAAAEMKEKIIKALSAAAYSEKSDAARLKKQMHLAESADIMTIDAFCIRMVQNNFHLLGVDSDISIADDAMAELIKAEALENLFSRLYKTEDDKERVRFSRLLAGYASNRDDRGLEQLILNIYKFISAFAEPEEWLDRAAEAYRLPPEEMPYAVHLINVSRRAAKYCLDGLSDISPLLEKPAASEKEETARVYLNGYISDLGSVSREMLSAAGWDGIYTVYNKYFRNLTRKKKFPYSVQQPPKADTEKYAAVLDRLVYLRAALIERLANGVTEDSEKLAKHFENAEHLAEEADDIVWIEKLFMQEYLAAKDRRSVREFSDIEHMTYELFKRHEDIREAYKAKYDEILIDEYQDTNGLQDSIFTLISKNNIFMVGDLKQSIYRFRGGDPYIFKDKSERYSELSGGIKITLAQNFRSRIEVLRSVNDVFGCVMSSEAGDVDYRGDELLVRDAERDYYPNPVCDCRSELHYLMLPPETDAGGRLEAEIRFTVNKIRELLSSGAMVYDKDSGRMRAIRKRDIVVLLNTPKGYGDPLMRELADIGIDAYCDMSTFFDRREIKVMMSLISVINNARQDVPLLAVMRSPIGGFTDDELARIRLCAGETDNFITAVNSYAKSGGRRIKRGVQYARSRLRYTPEPGKVKRLALARKCASFVTSLRRWRGYVRKMSVAQLIWTLYEETCFYDIMGAIEHGEEAQFNLRLLYERAKRYESAGFKGLFRFIEYIGRIEDSSKDLGGAKMIGENHDVVRIMTIHKSKGLEFPYVFLIGAGRLLKTGEGIKDIKLHRDLLMGLRDINYKERYIRNTALYDLIDAQNKSENKAERIRVLYVALTRAREKLYVITAENETVGGDDAVIAAHTQKLLGGKLLPEDALKIRSYTGWTAPAAFICPDSWKYEFHHIAAEADTQEKQKDDGSLAGSPELEQAVYDILNYRYPYEDSATLPSRTSVTQIKELTMERGELLDEPVYEPDSRRSSGADDIAELMFSPLHQKPAFMREYGGKSANEIGTLYHLIMSEISLDAVRERGAECVDDEITRLISEKVISEDDQAYIDTDKIKTFWSSPEAAAMLSSDRIYRESPFQINIPARVYDPSLTDTDETLILQGIIDCFFISGDRCTLIDYKTDKIKTDGKAIRRKYEKQLELYAAAIERLTGRKVTETYIYLFDNGEFV